MKIINKLIQIHKMMILVNIHIIIMMMRALKKIVKRIMIWRMMVITLVIMKIIIKTKNKIKSNTNKTKT